MYRLILVNGSKKYGVGNNDMAVIERKYIIYKILLRFLFLFLFSLFPEYTMMLINVNNNKRGTKKKRKGHNTTNLHQINLE
jgi:hypothetical protein